MLRNSTQNKQLYALLNLAGIDTETKEQMVYTYTRGRTNRSSKMSVEECQNLINDLRQKTSYNQESDTMRKKIISLFRKMSYTLPDGKVDMCAVEVWTEKYGYLHKPLNNYTYAELPKLVTQAQAVYQSFLKSV